MEHVSQNSGLLPQVRTIMARRGHVTLVTNWQQSGADGYMKTNRQGMLCKSFFIVTDDTVQKCNNRGQKREEPVSHAQFVADNLKYLLK